MDCSRQISDQHARLVGRLKNGSNTSGYYFNWGKGRQLESLEYGETAESAEIYVEYGYNAEGIRISRTFNVGGLEYIVDGDKILKQVGCGIGVLQTLEFYYDALGEIIGFNYANQDYYFGKNLQGDVVELYQGGTLIATYEYDAWGKLLSIKDANGVTIADDINSTHVAVINPIRYRGYYYDIEKSMYYLNSRYYYPTIGRFISADIPETLTADFENFAQYNLFAYCFNNPVNLSDETGTWPSWATKLAIGVGAIVIGAAVVAATAATGGAAAAFVGAAVAGLKTAVVSGAIGAAVGAGTSAVSHRVSTGGWSGAGKAAVDGAVDGFANGFMNGGIMAGGSQILSSGFKVAANAGVPTGRNGGLTIGNKVRVLSPNHPQAYEAGGTLLKIGSKYKNIRFDVGTNSLFHMNIQLAKTANYHLPIGMLGAGLWGGIAND